MQYIVILSSLCKLKRKQWLFLLYAVREAEKWRYAVRKAKIGRYATAWYAGVGGVTLIQGVLTCKKIPFRCL